MLSFIRILLSKFLLGIGTGAGFKRSLFEAIRNSPTFAKERLVNKITSAQSMTIQKFEPLLVPYSSSKIRVVVLGSFHGGFHVLKELLTSPLSNHVEVVGVATDDPTQPFTNAKVRLWKYDHTLEEELLVPRLAAAENLPVYSGRVKSPRFLETLREHWRPDLCLMATFGQKIPENLIEVPSLGFFNFHHSDATWPSYPGPDPIRDMLRDGKTEIYLTLHSVSGIIDDGDAYARSHAMPLRPGENSITVHRATWLQMGEFIREQVLSIIASRCIRLEPLAGCSERYVDSTRRRA
jgi:methionyl-tRNA formyltransferase